MHGQLRALRLSVRHRRIPLTPAVAEEDKKLFGHMFDDMGPGGGGGGDDDGSGSGSDLLSSGESGEEEEGEEDGWSEEEEEDEGPGARRGRRGCPDEMDELFGQVGGGGRKEEGLPSCDCSRRAAAEGRAGGSVRCTRRALLQRRLSDKALGAGSPAGS